MRPRSDPAASGGLQGRVGARMWASLLEHARVQITVRCGEDVVAEGELPGASHAVKGLGDLVWDGEGVLRVGSLHPRGPVGRSSGSVEFEVYIRPKMVPRLPQNFFKGALHLGRLRVGLEQVPRLERDEGAWFVAVLPLEGGRPGLQLAVQMAVLPSSDATEAGGPIEDLMDESWSQVALLAPAVRVPAPPQDYLEGLPEVALGPVPASCPEEEGKAPSTAGGNGAQQDLPLDRGPGRGEPAARDGGAVGTLQLQIRRVVFPKQRASFQWGATAAVAGALMDGIWKNSDISPGISSPFRDFSRPMEFSVVDPYAQVFIVLAGETGAAGELGARVLGRTRFRLSFLPGNTLTHFVLPLSLPRQFWGVDKEQGFAVVAARFVYASVPRLLRAYLAPPAPMAPFRRGELHSLRPRGGGRVEGTAASTSSGEAGGEAAVLSTALRGALEEELQRLWGRGGDSGLRSSLSFTKTLSRAAEARRVLDRVQAARVDAMALWGLVYGAWRHVASWESPALTFTCLVAHTFLSFHLHLYIPALILACAAVPVVLFSDRAGAAAVQHKLAPGWGQYDLVHSLNAARAAGEAWTPERTRTGSSPEKLSPRQLATRLSLSPGLVEAVPSTGGRRSRSNSGDEPSGGGRRGSSDFTPSGGLARQRSNSDGLSGMPPQPFAGDPQDRQSLLERYQQVEELLEQSSERMGEAVAVIERLLHLLQWEDPRLTSLFVAGCALLALASALVPLSYASALGGALLMQPPWLVDAASPATERHGSSTRARRGRGPLKNLLHRLPTNEHV